MDFRNVQVNANSYEATITVDCVVFGFQDNVLKVLLVRRTIQPFMGSWMLPGGIMDEGQSLNEAINHVLHNLTGIHDIHQEQVKAYGELDRHPMKRVITVCFYALIKPENHPVIARDYIADIKWFSMGNIPSQLGYDHNMLVQDAWAKLKQNVEKNLGFGELLPNEFTLKELQDLYECILGEKLDRRNFRKKILQLNLLESTMEKKVGVKGGPELYRLK